MYIISTLFIFDLYCFQVIQKENVFKDIGEQNTLKASKSS